VLISNKLQITMFHQLFDLISQYLAINLIRDLMDD